jgi:glycosyltransferase A (GT-A) superfamily protein (DUF2064 family)
MAKYHSQIFKDKPWSQPNLLTQTLLELDKSRQPYTRLKILNDIDTYEDLKQSFLINEID